jgi:hypothetical protein
MVTIFSFDNTGFNYTKTDTRDTMVIRNHSDLSEKYVQGITHNQSHILYR